MQELCWACETMTRQIRWEVCILDAAPAPPPPNKASRLSSAVLSSRSASHTAVQTQLRAVLARCLCLWEEGQEAVAGGTANHQELLQAPCPSVIRGQEGKGETKEYLKVPKGQGGRHLWADVQLVTEPLPTSQQGWHLGAPPSTQQVLTPLCRCAMALCRGQPVNPDNVMVPQRSWAQVAPHEERWHVWETGNNQTLLTLSWTQHNQDALLWASLHKTKATPHTAVTVLALCT